MLVGAALVFALCLLHPRVTRAPLWHATVTPLAAIIGSGFLVAGPILGATAGVWAWAAMAGLCALAYLFGEAVRHNIAHVEPMLVAGAPRRVVAVERAAGIALSLAYFVSVAYYLNLFAAFALRIGGITDPFWIRCLATAAIAVIGLLALRGGEAAMERVAVPVVGVKLSIILAIIAALGVATIGAAADGTLRWPAIDHPDPAHDLRVVLGLVVLVQGFETSRYLGEVYDGPTRIRTMRWAQWMASAIYLSFILLVTPYFGGNLAAEGGETGIIDMLRPIGWVIAPMIIGAAIASQLSAAVAETGGAGGLLSENAGRRFGANIGSLITALVAIAVTWAANIYQIIAYASQLFLAYYALQSLQAAADARRRGQTGRMLLFAAGTAAAILVGLFAAPAS